MNFVTPMNLNDQITISMASIPERADGMVRVMIDLLPYCDNFDVCLNGYPADVNYQGFNDPKVNVIRMLVGDGAGAGGKFYASRRTPGYHITVDDDLMYPQDYVATLIRGLEKYKRQAIVGIQGSFIVQGNASLISIYHQTALSQDIPVHMLGTGTMAYHTDSFNVDMTQFHPGKIDDQVAAMALQAHVPMIVLAHDANWLKEDTEVAMKRPLRRDLHALEAARQRMLGRIWTFSPMPE